MTMFESTTLSSLFADFITQFGPTKAIVLPIPREKLRRNFVFFMLVLVNLDDAT